MTVDFVIYLTHDEDHKLIYYPIYYALLTHARYIVLFCHGSTEEDQAQETDQNSDGFTINDVVDINDRHYFNIFFPWTQGIKPYFHFLYQQIRYICGYKPVFTDYLEDSRLIS